MYSAPHLLPHMWHLSRLVVRASKEDAIAGNHQHRARSHHQHIVHAHIVSISCTLTSSASCTLTSSASCTLTSSAPCTVQRRISTGRAHINIVHLTHTPASLLLNKSEWKHWDIIMMGIWPHFHFYIIKMHNTQWRIRNLTLMKSIPV